MSTRNCREIERKILQLLHGQKTRNRLHEIHAHFLRHGLDQFNQVLSHFVSVCGSLNKMAYADRIFDQTHYPNIHLFNAIIKGYSLCGPFQESLHLFSFMKDQGIWPDEYTFPPLLKACTSLCDLRLGQCVHREAIVSGFDWFSKIGIGVVELYTTCGTMEDGKKMFDEMSQRDVIVWNLMIRGHCKRGDVDLGLCLFRRMTEQSVISWNIMISGLAQSGRDAEALGLFHEMIDKGFKPDEATIVTVLPICTRSGALDVGKWIHSYVESSGLFRDFVSVGNALMDFYSKCGILEKARQIFDEMPRKNVVSWNAMILALALNGKGEVGVDLFEDMLNTGFSPNDATFLGLLSCCAHAKLVDRGRDLFSSMTVDYGIEPRPEHYGCMVDILGRSGCVREAYDLIRSMPETPNVALWGALLSASRTHGDVELAQAAAKELIDLEPWNSGNYVLLSNIYAEEGKWNEVEKVRVMMKERSVQKSPGQSLVM